jgi:hypothetical protein
LKPFLFLSHPKIFSAATSACNTESTGSPESFN